MMDDLISRKVAIETLALNTDYQTPEGIKNDLINHPGKECDWLGGIDEAISIIEELPSIPAVPLDRLCSWLAGHYGAPCQLAEIDPYPQCEPDENGECYGMRTDDKKCWHDYLIKWMEGLDDTEIMVQKT